MDIQARGNDRETVFGPQPLWGDNMILFTDRTNYIRVFRTKKGGAGVVNIGTIIKPDKDSQWIWDVTGIDFFRSWVGYQTLNNSERRQIIGLLDKLNGIDYRPQEHMRTRWNEIIGTHLAEHTA